MAKQPTSGDAQRLRADIDAGKLRDKVDYPDPATAPLGTDSEAGGSSPETDLVSGRHSSSAERRASDGVRAAWIWVVALSLAAAAIIVAALMIRA